MVARPGFETWLRGPRTNIIDETAPPSAQFALTSTADTDGIDPSRRDGPNAEVANLLEVATAATVIRAARLAAIPRYLLDRRRCRSGPSGQYLPNWTVGADNVSIFQIRT